MEGVGQRLAMNPIRGQWHPRGLDAWPSALPSGTAGEDWRGWSSLPRAQSKWDPDQRSLVQQVVAQQYESACLDAPSSLASLAQSEARVVTVGHQLVIAGGPEKCAWLKDEAGFDDVIDYKNEDVNARIAETCPNKLDVYFDNVGGDILEAALNHLNLRARIVMCGGISGYNATQPIPGPANLMNIVTTRSRMEGFIILDYMARAPEAINELLGWIGSGELKFQVDVQEGFDNIPDTLQRLFTGKNLGKQLLKIADPV